MSPLTTPTHGQTGMLGRFADVLADLEAVHHGAGWDNTAPTLYVVCNPHGELVTYPYQLGRLGELFGVDLHPRDELNMMADALDRASPLSAAAFSAITQAPPIGWLLVMEVWKHEEQIPLGVRESGPEAMQRWRDDFDKQREGKDLADIIGSVEARTGLGLMGTHRLYLDRTRGHDVTWYDLQKASGWSGVMFDAMVRIHTAASKLW